MTPDSSLVLLSLLGYFPPPTFSFFSLSRCFKFTQEASSQFQVPIGPYRKLRQWSVPPERPHLPGVVGCESKAIVQVGPCAVCVVTAP